MKKIICSVLIFILSTLLFSCSTSTKMSGKTYTPQTQEVDHYRYTPYFQLNTELIPHQLEITLITQLHKETIPGAYSLKKFTRRLLPNDYMVPGSVILYLKNLTTQAINIEFYSINIDQKHLPLSVRNLSIPANGYQSVHLGQVNVDLRAINLYTSIEYRAKSHKEKAYDMRRISKNEAKIHDENKKVVNKNPPEMLKTSKYTPTVNGHTYTHEKIEKSTIEFRENNPIENYFKQSILVPR